MNWTAKAVEDLAKSGPRCEGSRACAGEKEVASSELEPRTNIERRCRGLPSICVHQRLSGHDLPAWQRRVTELMNGLLTDLYELTMAAGYFQAGKAEEIATFEFAIRRLPPNRNFVLAAGLPQAVDYLLSLSFTAEEIAYLRGLPQFARRRREFFDYLRDFRFTGDLFAVPEGTPLFAGEPLLTRARAHHRSADSGNLPAVGHRAFRA